MRTSPSAMVPQEREDEDGSGVQAERVDPTVTTMRAPESSRAARHLWPLAIDPLTEIEEPAALGRLADTSCQLRKPGWESGDPAAQQVRIGPTAPLERVGDPLEV